MNNNNLLQAFKVKASEAEKHEYARHPIDFKYLSTSPKLLIDNKKGKNNIFSRNIKSWICSRCL